MPIFLSKHTAFPDPSMASEDGIIAVGGKLSRARLLEAYGAGIFPWPHQGYPLLWFCPDPRFVLEPRQVVVNQSLKKILKKTSLTIKADFDFLSVIKKCQASSRLYQDGTWITDEMVFAYHDLFQNGFAHSIEAYDHDILVGGLYGVSLGSIFFGESMFFEKSNASKICFITLVAHLIDWNFSLIDCQAYTNNLEKFGAHAMPRDNFLRIIESNRTQATKLGPWQLSMSPLQALSLITGIQKQKDTP